MKRFLVLTIIVFNVLLYTGCTKNTEYRTEYADNNYITINKNKDDELVIPKENITSIATFINYVVEDTTIQLIAVRGTDGEVRVSFNTCNVCSPSPNAYFKQVGEYLECQNCGNRFHIDELGNDSTGCNPMPVKEKNETETTITLKEEYVTSLKSKFLHWQGPTKKDMQVNAYN